LAWIFFLLTQHPEIYQAVVEELDSVLHGAVPTPQQLAELPLLDRVVKESMRLLPALPFLLFRQPQIDVELGGYHIPKDSLIVISPLITHRLPHLYDNPQQFLPERWSRIKPGAFDYLPFSAGPRLCLGIGFASQEIRIVLATLLQRFKFHLEPNLPVNYHLQSLILGPKGGLPMRLLKPGDPAVQTSPVWGNIHKLVHLR
jgi:cytochrome P450